MPPKKERKPSPGWRLEYWLNGKKYIRRFGSQKQAWAYVRSLGTVNVGRAEVTQEGSDTK